MTNEEMLDYLTPIAENASLPNYRESLFAAVKALKIQTYGCCWCSPFINGDLYLKTGEAEFDYIPKYFCPACGRHLGL